MVSSKRQAHSTKWPQKKLERSYISDLVICLKALEQKEGITPKWNRQQETIKLMDKNQ